MSTSEVVPVLFSASTLRQAKKLKVDVQELQTNVKLRKQVIDAAFAKLVSRALMPPPSADYDLPANLALANTAGSFPGRIVALLSTGETGIILEKPDRKCIVKLDQSGESIKVCWDELYWMRRCNGPEDAINQIVKACGLIPQVSDVKRGDRVAIMKLHYQTAHVVKLPESTKNCCFTLKLDYSGNMYKCKANGFRLIPKCSPVVGPLCDKRGRPKASWVKEQRKLRKPMMLVPASKSDAWVKALIPPKVLPPARAVDEAVLSESEDSFAEGSSDEEGSEVDENEPPRQTEFLL